MGGRIGVGIGTTGATGATGATGTTGAGGNTTTGFVGCTGVAVGRTTVTVGVVACVCVTTTEDGRIKELISPTGINIGNLTISGGRILGGRIERSSLDPALLSISAASDGDGKSPP